MELFEAISKRHSYRAAFTEAKVPREDLQKIVQAGIQAPSGCNAQTTSFVIVDDPAILDSIYSILKKDHHAPAMIVCLAEKTIVFEDMSFELEDCAAAVENILLATTALGYATVWTDGALRLNDCGRRIGKLLGVPENLQIQIVLPIGVPAKECQQAKKKSFAERAWFNSYDG
jgi:nitroreductase